MCVCCMYHNVPSNIPTHNFRTLKRTFQAHQHRIFPKHIIIGTYTRKYNLYRNDEATGKAGKRYYNINFKEHLRRRTESEQYRIFCIEFNIESFATHSIITKYSTPLLYLPDAV